MTDKKRLTNRTYNHSDASGETVVSSARHRGTGEQRPRMQTGQPVRQQASRQINYNGTTPPPVSRPPAGRRGMAKLPSIFWIAIILLLGVMAVGGGVLLNTMNKISGGKNALSVIESVRNPRGQFPASMQSRVNILLIGKDYDYDWHPKDPKLKGARTAKNSRSDTIAMVSLDLDSNRVSILSVPRDTVVRAPEKLGSSNMVEGKINATYRRGGAELLGETVGELLGVKPDFYIAVKPDALKNIVDALGGVEVETLDSFKYTDWAARLFVDLPKGKQTIDGTQAIGFARFREADIYKRNPDGSPIPLPGSHTQFYLKSHHEIVHSLEEGEPRRMARQQQLIRAMTHKAQSFQNLFKLDQLVNVGLGQVETDMSRSQIFALASLFRGIKPEQIQSATLKGHGVLKNLYFFHPDQEKKQLMVDWLLKGDETAGNRLTVVEVQNGTDVTGAANRYAEVLRAQGFEVRATSNSDRGEGGHEIEKSRVVFHTAAVAGRAENIAKLLGNVPITKEPRLDKTGINGYDDEPVDVIVIIGRDLATAPGTKSVTL